MTSQRRRHLLIAGTGRAGTSFLVRLLTELGLDTHISRAGEGSWDEAAQAGLEDLPVSTSAARPYVIKQPWAYQMIDQILADPGIELEAVIVPVRDPTEVAVSRTVLEIRAMHQRAPWMARLDRSWDHWGITPGGGVFSLDPTDQARLMAVGFQRLMERLVRADVPVVLLSFPRLIDDPDYLYTKLQPVLPADLTAERILRAHEKIADLRKVRVARELRDAAGASPPREGATAMPSFETLDNIALRRELDRLRAMLADAEAAKIRAARSSVRNAAGRLAGGCARLLGRVSARLDGFGTADAGGYEHGRRRLTPDLRAGD